MTMKRFTFDYSPSIGLNKDKWYSSARTWKTLKGAEDGAARWAAEMSANDCPVNIRAYQIDYGRSDPATTLYSTGDN